MLRLGNKYRAFPQALTLALLLLLSISKCNGRRHDTDISSVKQVLQQHEVVGFRNTTTKFTRTDHSFMTKKDHDGPTENDGEDMTISASNGDPNLDLSDGETPPKPFTSNIPAVDESMDMSQQGRKYTQMPNMQTPQPSSSSSSMSIAKYLDFIMGDTT